MTCEIYFYHQYIFNIIDNIQQIYEVVIPSLIFDDVIDPKAIRNVLTPTFITDVAISFKSRGNVKTNGYIEIYIPKSQINAQFEFPIVKQSNNQVIAYNFEISDKFYLFRFQEFCSFGPQGCPSGTEFFIKILDMINPVSASSQESLIIKVLTNLKEQQEQTLSNLFITPSLTTQPFNNLIITSSSVYAGAETTYIVSMTLSSSVSSTGTFSIIFPQRSAFALKSNNCKVIQTSEISVDCTLILNSDQSIQKVKFLNPCSTQNACQALQDIQLQVVVQNQLYVYDNFQGQTFKVTADSNQDVQLAEGIYQAALIPSIQAGVIQNASVESNSKEVLVQPVTLTLKFTLANNIPKKDDEGSLKCIMPADILDQTPSSCQASVEIDSQQLTMICQILGNSIYVQHDLINKNLGGKIITIKIFGVKNPSDNRVSGIFSIETWQTYNGVSVKIDKLYQKLTYQADVLGALIITSVIRSNDIMASSVDVQFRWTIYNDIPNQGQVFIDILPSLQLEFSESNIVCYDVNHSNSQVDCFKYMTGILINYDLCDLNSCTKGSSFKLNIVGLKNPSFKADVKSTNSIGIFTQPFNSQHRIDGKNTGSDVLPELKQNLLTVSDIIRGTNIVLFQDQYIQASIQTPTNLLIHSYNLVFTFPQYFLRLSDTTPLSSVLLPSNNIVSANSQLYDDGSVKRLIIPSYCTSLNCPLSTKVTIKLLGLINGDQVANYQTAKFSIATMVYDYTNQLQNLDFPVDQSINSVFTQLLPDIVTSFTAVADTPLINAFGVLRITFETSQIILKDTYIVITLSDQIQISDFPDSQSRCKGTIGMSTQLICKKVSNQIFVQNDQNSPSSYIKQFELLEFQSPYLANSYPVSIKIQTKNNNNVQYINQEPTFLKIYFPLITTCQGNCGVCDTFNSPSCVSCKIKSNYPLQRKNECLDNCPIGTFLVQDQAYCMDCPKYCIECSSGLSNGCLKCENGYFLDSGSCKSACPIGTTPDFLMVCQSNQQCNSICKTCGKNKDFCTSCNNDYKFEPSTGLCTPKLTPCQFNNYYYESSLNKCLPCKSQCISCSSSQTCNGCSQYFLTSILNLLNKQCVQTCPSDKYSDGFQCNSCDQSCLTCENGSNFGCLTCPSIDTYKYFDYGKCQSLCPQGSTEVNLKCITQCSNPKCSRCDEQVKNICIECNQDPFKILINGNCVKLNECPDGKYAKLNSLTNKYECVACSTKNCRQCYPNNICTSCYNDINTPATLNIFQNVHQGVCLQTCPTGMSSNHLADKKCEYFTCTAPCQDCGNTADQCVNCLPSSLTPYTQQYKCIKQCTEGFYLSSNNKHCLSCNSNCMDCFGSSTSCTKCKLPLHLHLQKCISACPDDYFVNPITNQCYPGSLTGYQDMPSAIVSFACISMAWILYSKYKAPTKFDMMSSLIALFSAIEWLSKVFMLATFYKMSLPGAMSFNFMTILTNSILALMLKTFYMGLFEEHLNSFKKFKFNHYHFYNISGYLMVIIGPNFAKIFSSGLFGIPVSIFETLSPFKLSLNRLMFYSLFISCLQVGLDIYALSSFSVILIINIQMRNAWTFYFIDSQILQIHHIF